MHGTNQQIKECLDLRACAYGNWYKRFRKITPKSICIPLPDEIHSYLLDEIIILPKECYPKECEAQETDANDNDKDDNDSDDEDEVVQPEFPTFSASLSKAISRLGGAVFVKTNWDSPKDAFWITAGQTMCCKDITDIYQLLKASGTCKENLAYFNLPIFDTNVLDETNASSSSSSSTDTDPSDDTNISTNTSSNQLAPGNNQFLIFKKWHDIHPGTEFRCFVRNRKLIGISPRDWPQYHDYICSQRVNIVNDIVSIFKEHIKPKFPLFDYAFDVVRDSKDRVFLLDFSPFNEKYTESLAFEWTELLYDSEVEKFHLIGAGDDEEDPEFRYLSTDCGIQPSKRNNYGIPKDVIDMFRVTSNQSSNTLDDIINNHLRDMVLNQTDDD